MNPCVYCRRWQNPVEAIRMMQAAVSSEWIAWQRASVREEATALGLDLETRATSTS
jgi:hypothetical protein